MGKTIYIPSNYTGYRYYTIVINKQAVIDNTNDNIGFGEWQLYGVKEIKCVQYDWDIPSMTLNKSGKISMEAKAYNTYTPTTVATTTRINNIGSTKYNYNSKNNSVIIDVSHWDYSKKKNKKCPGIQVAPQVINKISLSVQPEDNKKGVDDDSDFVAVLKISEDDVPETRWSN